MTLLTCVVLLAAVLVLYKITVKFDLRFRTKKNAFPPSKK